MRIPPPLGTAVLATFLLSAQTPAPPQFEVASVKLSPPGAPDRVSIGVHVDGAHLTCNYLNLRDYLRMAYRVKDYQISGPEWLASDRYNIAATLPAGSTQAQVPDMIKALLADRFQVRLHHETREFPVYAMVVDKGGLKIQLSADQEMDTPGKAPVNVTGGGSRDGVAIDLGHGSYFNFANNKLEAKKLTMATFAETLARFEDKPVVDLTGLNGVYDILLNFSDDDYRAMLIRSAVNAGLAMTPQALQAMEAASGDSIGNAMRAAGLRLEPRKAPFDVLVIDSAQKTPTEN